MDNVYRGVWFDGIIVEDLEQQTFVVQYENLIDDDDVGVVQGEIHAQNIRIPLPNTGVFEFGVLEEVEAFYKKAWCSGMVIELLGMFKSSSKSKYKVHLFYNLKDLEFDHSDLRSRRVFINGNWVIAQGMAASLFSVRVCTLD